MAEVEQNTSGAISFWFQTKCTFIVEMFLFSVNFNYLFGLNASEPETRQGEKALAMAVHTLRMMAKGGIYDHVAKVTVVLIIYFMSFLDVLALIFF